MTTSAERLSDEVLYMIFDGFDFYEANEIQHVCPAWYRVAHTFTLKDVGLFDKKSVQRFIEAIDSNPHPTYLAAVEEITIYSSGGPFVFTEEEIRKAFFRFPNLKTVKATSDFGCFKEMTDELCKEFLTRCPQLQEFKLDYNFPFKPGPEIYEELHPVRSLLTELKVDKQINETRFKDDVWNYITGSSNIQSLRVTSKELDTFGKFLKAFQHLPKLETLNMQEVKDDQRNFAEDFLASLTQEEQEQIIKRLSEFKELYWSRDTGFCLYTIKFIEKYMTGLEHFDMFSSLAKPWNNMDQLLFCQAVTEIICSAKGSDVLLAMNYETLNAYYRLMLHRIFYKPAAASKDTKRRVLVLKLDNDIQDPNWTNLSVVTSPPIFPGDETIVTVTISLCPQVILQEVKDGLLTDDTILGNIDVFSVIIDKRRESTAKVTTGTYCKILQGMKSVWRVALDIPASFKNNLWEHSERYPLMTDLHINATSRPKFHMLLHEYSFIFPNLKHLYFKYFCGVWDRSIGGFELSLSDYSLKSLSIDVTPVVVKMKKFLRKKEIKEEDYFVLRIDTFGNDSRLLYKVLIKSMKATRISSQDLEGLRCGKDYLHVHITVQALTNWFQLSRNNNNENSPDENEEYFDDSHWGRYEVVRLDQDTVMETA